MDKICERIVNIGVLENKIKSARCNAENIEKLIQQKDYSRAEEIAKTLSLQMHEIDCFEFCIEQRKIKQIE